MEKETVEAFGMLIELTKVEDVITGIQKTKNVGDIVKASDLVKGDKALLEVTFDEVDRDGDYRFNFQSLKFDDVYLSADDTVIFNGVSNDEQAN